MADTVLDWPPAFAPRVVTFRRRGMTLGGPRTLTGRRQRAFIDTGYWTGTLERIPVGDPDAVKAWRAFTAMAEDGVVRVPVFDRDNAPWPVAGVYTTPPTTFSDGTTFTDGTGFYERTIRITANGAAAARVTQIGATIDSAATIVGGEYFTAGEHLHVIRRVLSVSGADQVWAIRPSLRAPLADGDVLEFDRPTCLMHFLGEDDADLALTYGRYGFPSPNFVEVI